MSGRPFIAYALGSEPPPLRPAPHARDWMDWTNNRYAYRCLPLVVGNLHGWEILSTVTVTAEWDGLRQTDPLQITVHEGSSSLVKSHFGHGILTFHVGYVFRTPPGINLWVKGPSNRPKDGICALEGLVETDWSAAPFTMNWRFTRPRATVTFERGEPICTLVPFPRGLLEEMDPQILPIEADAELKAAHDKWVSSRQQFLGDLHKPGSEAQAARWQKHYFRGVDIEGESFDEHQTRISLKPFRSG